MLVAQRNFQVEYVFAVTLKAKMSRLDHAGVNRPHGNFVDFLPLDAVKIGDADDGSLARLPAPGIVPRSIGGVKPNRLEPRMPFGTHAVLFGDFSLEEVHLRTVRSHGRKTIRFQRCLAHVQLRTSRIGQDHVKIDVARLIGSVAKQSGDCAGRR